MRPSVCSRCEKRVATYHLCNDDPYRSKACTEPECSGLLCDNCSEPTDADLSAYYGGSSPQTLSEQQAAARDLKEGRWS